MTFAKTRLAGAWLVLVCGLLAAAAPPAAAARKATMTLLDSAAPMPERIAAAKALGKSHDAGAVDALLQVLGTRNEQLVEASVSSLRALDAAPRLAATVDDANAPTERRLLAARGLRLLKDPRTLPTLTRAAASPLVELRKEGCLALGQLGAPEGLDPLIRVMNEDPDTGVRYIAANAVGRIPGPKTRTALEQRLPRERDPLVQSALKAALRKQSPSP